MLNFPLCSSNNKGPKGKRGKQKARPEMAKLLDYKNNSNAILPQEQEQVED